MSGISSYNANAGRFCTLFGDGLENTSRLITLFGSIGRIGVCSLQLQGKTFAGMSEMNSAFNAAGATVSAVRFVITLEKIFSGKLFWRQEDNGEFFRAKLQGNYPERDASGNYVRALVSENGVFIPRDWIDLALDASLAVGRIFSTVLYFSKIKLYDLGKHANWIGHVIIATFAAVVTLSAVSSTVACIQEDVTSKKFKKRIADMLSSFFDILSFPGESGLGFSHPAAALTAAILSAVGAGGYLLKEWIYYNVDKGEFNRAAIVH